MSIELVLTPSSVMELVARGHRVMVESDAGTAIDFSNQEYSALVLR